MISPLHIATEGYLCNPLAVATSGYISLCDLVITEDELIVIKKQGGGVMGVTPRYSPVRYVDPTERVRLIREQVLKEEEEIIIFIKAFLKCQ